LDFYFGLLYHGFNVYKEHIMIKTMSFAMLHFSVAFTIAYLFTGSILVGGLMALIEPACNTVVFYFHERAWQRHQHAHDMPNAIEPDEHEWAYAA
jgi:uncharacterized membrane protein